MYVNYYVVIIIINILSVILVFVTFTGNQVLSLFIAAGTNMDKSGL